RYGNGVARLHQLLHARESVGGDGACGAFSHGNVDLLHVLYGSRFGDGEFSGSVDVQGVGAFLAVDLVAVVQGGVIAHGGIEGVVGSRAFEHLIFLFGQGEGVTGGVLLQRLLDLFRGQDGFRISGHAIKQGTCSGGVFLSAIGEGKRLAGTEFGVIQFATVDLLRELIGNGQFVVDGSDVGALGGFEDRNGNVARCEVACGKLSFVVGLACGIRDAVEQGVVDGVD